MKCGNEEESIKSEGGKKKWKYVKKDIKWENDSQKEVEGERVNKSKWQIDKERV